MRKTRVHIDHTTVIRKKKEKIKMRLGILTFHASHNFGSVMQAWATQNVLANLGYSSEIINFRMLSQKDKYSIFPLRSGWRVILRNILQIKYIKQKYMCYTKYENFIKNNFSLSAELNHASEFSAVADVYDIFLSGSDQIWGYHVPEFVRSAEDARRIYYLEFTTHPKISYASSTGTSTLEELARYKCMLNRFDYLSVREPQGQLLIEELLCKKISLVLDPTYLISKATWCRFANKQQCVVTGKYVLIYTLQGRRKAKKWKQLINSLSTDNVCDGYQIVTISPFAPIDGHGIYNLAYAGPEEILNFFCHAEFVFTDTFHGMSFAIHFRKQFVVFEDGETDSRKRNILTILHLEHRETNDISQALSLFKQKMNYEEITKTLKPEVAKSKKYLTNAIEGCCKFLRNDRIK